MQSYSLKTQAHQKLWVLLIETVIFEENTHKLTAFKKGDKQHVSCGDWAQLPLLTLPFSFMKTDSSCEVRLWILHRLPPRFGFLLAVSSELSRVESQCEAREGEGKLSRNIGVQGRGFTCPRPGPQKNARGHSWSQICYQVRKCLTKVEQMGQPALVCFLHWERKAISITRYFLIASSETFVFCALIACKGKNGL